MYSFYFSVLEATRVNNISVVELLVRVPGTVSQRELDASLVAAAKAKSTECARILLDAGADANTQVHLLFGQAFSFSFWTKKKKFYAVDVFSVKAPLRKRN